MDSLRVVPTQVVRYNYRLRPSDSARRALEEEWNRVRWVWNICVERSKAATLAHETCGTAKLDKELTALRAKHDWLAAGSSVCQQQVIRDFGAARANALKDMKDRLPHRQRRGLPRFKSKRRAQPSLNYTKRGFSLSANGRLRLPRGVSIPIVWSRELPSSPGSVRVFRDTLGHWWASFVVARAIEPLPATGRDLGIDWGVTATATTTSPIHDLAHAEHQKEALPRLRRYERQLSRRRRPKGQAESTAYRATRKRLAKEKRAIVRRRSDDRRKWAKKVVRDFDRIACEDFRPKFLAKSTMARKAADGAISAAKHELISMAAKHDRKLVLIDPKYTTIECSRCGARAKHRLELTERTYNCAFCGVALPRDENAASVMLVRAGFNPAGAEGISRTTPTGEFAA